MMNLPISGFIIAKNEEKRIAKAINSIIDIVDELYVIDSGSEDKTVEIAKNLGAKVVYNKWPGYIEQKIFGENLCKNQWILNIDADEELSEDLQNEIKFIFTEQRQDKYKAYRINLVILKQGEDYPRFCAPANDQIRLYNKNYASFANKNYGRTHDAVLMKENLEERGNVYLFNNIAYHRTATSIEQLVTKANFYSTQQALDLFDRNRKPSIIRIVSESTIWFFKYYIFRRYFILGFEGFCDSMIFAFSRFMRLAKARKLFDKD